MAKKVEIAPRHSIIREGNAIIIPNTISLDQALTIITNHRDHEEQVIGITREFENVPWADAALALSKAMEQEFIWVDAQTTWSFWEGKQPPKKVKVKSGPNGETVNVAVGKFQLEALEKAICFIGVHQITQVCQCQITCKRKYETLVNTMLDKAERLMREESIYRGRALTFNIEENEFFDVELDDIGFMQLGDTKTLILPAEVDRDVRANIWTILAKKEACMALGVPSKRTILLYGNYGTGKTLIAHQTAHLTKTTGHTFVYVPDAHHLSASYRFALTMIPAVLFVEDGDRYVNDSEYVAEMANVLDGINTKDSDVMLIMTTNHVEKIPPVLLRPGRIDASIEVTLPDTATVKRLIEVYAPSVVGDIAPACKALAGHIPSVIREACERGKLFTVADDRQDLEGRDILAAAKSMQQQMKLLDNAMRPKRKPTAGDILHHGIARAVREKPDGAVYAE